MKKLLAMMAIVGLVGFLAGCGKEEPAAPAVPKSAEKAGAEAGKAVDKAAADAKAAAEKATK